MNFIEINNGSYELFNIIFIKELTMDQINIINNYKNSDYLTCDCYDIKFDEIYYYIKKIPKINILKLANELRSFVEYLNKNNIPWKGLRNTVTLTDKEEEDEVGIMIMTKIDLLFITSDGDGNINKESYPLQKDKI